MNQTSKQQAIKERGSIFSIASLIVASWQLAKVGLCSLIGVSTFFGGLFAQPASYLQVITCAIGVMFVAMAGATINSLQERKTDSTLSRTAQRPMVLGQVTIRHALIQGVLLLFTGLLIIWLASTAPLFSVLMTIGAILIYNGVYTPLKQKTFFSLPIGAISGALPPLIGLISSGGQLFSYISILIFSLLFLWQVPHFCLILLNHRQDYTTIDQPTFLKMFEVGGVKRLSSVWVGALGLVMLLFVTSELVTTTGIALLVIANATCFTLYMLKELLFTPSPLYTHLFISLNCMLVAHMGIIAIGSFLL